MNGWVIYEPDASKWYRTIPIAIRGTGRGQIWRNGFELVI